MDEIERLTKEHKVIAKENRELRGMNAALDKECDELKRKEEELYRKAFVTIHDLEKDRDEWKARALAAELERDCLTMQRHMTIARLGGTVEGHPTSEINFLQRVDELREKERSLGKAVAACRGALKLPRPWLDTFSGRKGSLSFEEWDGAISAIEAVIQKAGL